MPAQQGRHGHEENPASVGGLMVPANVGWLCARGLPGEQRSASAWRRILRATAPAVCRQPSDVSQFILVALCVRRTWASGAGGALPVTQC